MNKTYTTLKNEDGAVLVTGLMVLAVLSLLGIAAISTSITEVQIAGNDKFSKVAFYAAEGAVQDGLSYLENHSRSVSDHLRNSPEKQHVFEVEQEALGDATYDYKIVSLDPPDENLPTGYKSRPRTQFRVRYNANHGSEYASSAKVYRYYYQVDGRGNAGRDSISTISVIAFYPSEN